MSSAPHTTSQATQVNAARAVVDALLRCGITVGFGIPSIHNIALYDALRQEPDFRHWIVRHEQAAVFAADGFNRSTGQTAAVFASTGPGNLFTVSPLLESFQTNTPLVLIGTNVASQVLGKTCGALHETPQQLEIIKPLTRFATRISSPDDISHAIAAAASAGGPAFVEIPHDLLLAPLNLPEDRLHPEKSETLPFPEELTKATEQIEQSRKPVLVIGSDVEPARGRERSRSAGEWESAGEIPAQPWIGADATASVQKLAEILQSPIMTTTSGKGAIADDHPLAMGCISRLGVAQELLLESDLMISIGARFTEFDTGRFSLKVPARHIQIEQDLSHVGLQFPFTARLMGEIGAIAQTLAAALKARQSWFDVAKKRAEEKQRLQALGAEAYEALLLLRGELEHNDVIANDQSILNYWASAFFSVLAPRSWLYPTGSGTLGYGLPAAIGAACAARQEGRRARVICIVGDGGFQYTSQELATLAHYQLPVKILLV